MENKVYITNIQRFCYDDGPGIRTTVFLKGCPLRCLWCHNPETHSSGPELFQRGDKCSACGRCIPVCPANGRTIINGILQFDRDKCIKCGKCEDICPDSACEICGKEMTAGEILDVVMKDKIFYETSGGGFTISGGECASFPEFTLELIRNAKDNDIDVCIETSGYGSAEFFESAAGLGVKFLYDIKEINPEKHKKFTGVENKKILENLLYLFSVDADITIRLPLIPGYNDSDEDLKLLSSFLHDNNGKYKGYEIMPYHTLGIGKSKSLDKEYIDLPKELWEDSCSSQKERWNNIIENGWKEI